VLTRWAERTFEPVLARLTRGTLCLVTSTGVRTYGEPARDRLEAQLEVHDRRFFVRALAGEIGLAESYMDGDWSTADLVAVVRLAIRNMTAVDAAGGVLGALKRMAASLARRLRDNTIARSRRHIRRHYDLGNDFFGLFLDERLMYSCARFESPGDTLERAQERKLDGICRRLALGPSDHVLEIGTGWGGFAAWAATRYGCRITTTTISGEQFRHAQTLARRLAPHGANIEVLQRDYRQLEGVYDAIVSIEMFEAVGLTHYDDFFGAVDRLLAPDGVMFLQTITMDDRHFPRYHAGADWIEKYIFPGGELASLTAILQSVARATTLTPQAAENIGLHYARTLAEWRARFHAQLDAVRALGFDDRFVRMWDLYLASCEAAFLEERAGTFQIVLARPGSRRMRPAGVSDGTGGPCRGRTTDRCARRRS
jgi:cyclopropane-fatty-acyl-phospholipid synthase